MAKTRILLLCQHYYPESVSTGLHMTELTTKLVELYPQNEISVFCSFPTRTDRNDTIPFKETHKEVGIVRIKNIGKEHGGGIWQRFIFSFNYFVKALIFTVKSRKNIDVLLITTNPPFIGIVAIIMKTCFAIPYLLITYDIYPDIAVKLGIIKNKSFTHIIWNLITSYVFKFSDSIVVIGEDMKKIVMSKIPSKYYDKITIIHNWADSTVVKPINRSKNRFLDLHSIKNKDVLLYSGNMGRTHGIELILEAAVDLNEFKNIVFVFIGSGEKRGLVENHIDSQKSTNVLLLPFQSLNILADTLAAASLSIVSLDNDFTGFSVPSKTYGCMAAGTAILGLLSRDSEIGKTIIKYECGILFDNNSSKELSKTILSALSNKEQLEKMALNSYQAFINNFDLPFAAKKYNLEISKVKAKADRPI